MAMTIVENHLLSVTGGIDTHRDFHVTAAIDPNGGVLGVETFETTTGGHRRLVAWLAAFGDIDLVGDSTCRRPPTDDDPPSDLGRGMPLPAFCSGCDNDLGISAGVFVRSLQCASTTSVARRLCSAPRTRVLHDPRFDAPPRPPSAPTDQSCVMRSNEISTAVLVPLFSSQCLVLLSSGQPTPGP